MNIFDIPELEPLTGGFVVKILLTPFELKGVIVVVVVVVVAKYC